MAILPSKVKMRLILHIGPPKTGSTSIQAFLNAKQKKLTDCGIWPLRLRQMNMSEFQWAFVKEDHRSLGASNRLGINSGNLKQYKRRFLTEIADLLREAKTYGAKGVVISSEGIASLSQTVAFEAGSMTDMAEFISDYVDEVSVITVLRRQDLRAVSRYKNICKNKGWSEQNCFVHDPSMDFNVWLPRWAQTFGEESVKPILFPDSVAEKRNLIFDFCNAAGFGHLYNQNENSKFIRNSSIDGRAIEIMRRLNIANPDRHHQDKNKIVVRFNKFIEEFYAEPKQKIRLRKDDAKQFLSKYNDGNEQIRQTMFPGRKELFSGDFSMYGETSEFPKPTTDDLYEIINHLLYDQKILRADRGKNRREHQR